ncbi:unnamed protein product [Timema podura]|uniref:Recombination activating protein 2 n=1 Tax=Timema podura TaxID=61482 RepID=A0ABN7NGP1_TIMPD|nr:unnamed protein product [Timema podura]
MDKFVIRNKIKEVEESPYSENGANLKRLTYACTFPWKSRVLGCHPAENSVYLILHPVDERARCDQWTFLTGGISRSASLDMLGAGRSVSSNRLTNDGIKCDLVVHPTGGSIADLEEVSLLHLLPRHGRSTRCSSLVKVLGIDSGIRLSNLDKGKICLVSFVDDLFVSEVNGYSLFVNEDKTEPGKLADNPAIEWNSLLSGSGSFGGKLIAFEIVSMSRVNNSGAAMHSVDHNRKNEHRNGHDDSQIRMMHHA